MYDRESIVLGSNFKNAGFDGLTCLAIPLNPKINFSDWSAFVSVIIITQKQIIAETSNLVFRICIPCKCYLKLFMMIG